MENVIVYRNDDTLQHHGIKGQKWGVRRYQNPDGTLTAEGRAHYGRLKNDYEKGITTLEGNERVAKTMAKVAAPAVGAAYGVAGASIASSFGAGTGAAIGAGALSGGLGLAALGGGMALGIGINHLIKKHYNKRISEINDLMDDEKMKKAQELVDSVKDKPVKSLVNPVTDAALEKKMKELTNSKDFWPNERKFDREFLERMDNPVHVDYLSDGSLDRLWAMKKAGASWDQLYKEKDRLERLEAKMKS